MSPPWRSLLPGQRVASTRRQIVPMDDDVALPPGFTRGPWDPGALHGGPVAALLACSVEQLHSDEVDWFVAGLTVELERPVPITPLRFHAEVTRPGRKVSIVEATITRAGSGAVGTSAGFANSHC